MIALTMLFATASAKVQLHMKKTVDPTVLEVTITAQEEHMFLKYNSPLDSALFACEGFEVHDLTTGEDLEFTGAIAKRRAPEDEDFHYFEVAGQDVAKSVDLAHCFDFQQDHSYQVNLNTKFMTDRKVTSTQGITLLANQNTTPLLKSKSQRSNFKLFNNFDGCDSTEISTSQDAVTNAINALDDAMTNVLEPGCANEDYERFMGVHTQERYFTVQSHFTNILSRFNSEEYIIVCNDNGCSSGIFAFVYPTDSQHNIYVCDAYWSASVTIAFDSKPGTLIHEMSHFADVAGTDDHQYGVSGNENLASTQPCLSVDNADSHEYFIEQVPTSGTNCCTDLTTGTCTSSLDYCVVSGSTCMEVSQAEDGVGPDTQEGWCDSNVITTTSNCQNSPGADGGVWTDSDANGPYTCQDYAINVWCDQYGVSVSEDGLSAYDACCACGGGTETSGTGTSGTSSASVACLSSLGLYYVSVVIS